MSEKKEKSGINSESAVKKLANLTPFPKGVSGNPLGRLVGSKNKTTILREAMQAMQIKDKNGEPVDDPLFYMATKILEIIEDKEGNPAVQLNAIERLLDRYVGTVERTVRHGRTADELAIAGQKIFQDISAIKNAEEAEVIDN